MVLKWEGDQIIHKVKAKSEEAMTRAGVFLQKKMQESVNISARRGKTPSKAGQPPRVRTAFGRSNIVVNSMKVGGHFVVRVGVTRNAIYMAYLELGIRARTIRARGGGYLKIPMLFARGSGLSAKELKEEYGAKKIGRDWVIFRKQVTIGPIAPRPFMRPALHNNRRQIALIASGGELTE